MYKPFVNLHACLNITPKTEKLTCFTMMVIGFHWWCLLNHASLFFYLKLLNFTELNDGINHAVCWREVLLVLTMRLVIKQVATNFSTTSNRTRISYTCLLGHIQQPHSNVLKTCKMPLKLQSKSDSSKLICCTDFTHFNLTQHFKNALMV